MFQILPILFAANYFLSEKVIDDGRRNTSLIHVGIIKIKVPNENHIHQKKNINVRQYRNLVYIFHLISCPAYDSTFWYFSRSFEIVNAIFYFCYLCK